MLALPDASVLADTLESDAPAPPAGVTEKVTVAPTTGLLLASVRMATSGEPKAVLIAVLWLLPEKTATFAASPGVLVSENVAGVTGIILNLPQRMIDVANAAFGPGERDPNGPLSVVGVGRVAGEVAATDQLESIDKAAGLVGILASLNVALFVFNMIPLLPLDGGHIAGALWEAIRRGFAKLFRRPDPGPVDLAKLMPVTLAVVVVLGGMSALLIYADLVKPIALF